MSILIKARIGDTVRVSNPLTGDVRDYWITYMTCALCGPLDDGSDVKAYCINPTYDERYAGEYVLSESILARGVQRGSIVELIAGKAKEEGGQ